MIGSYSLVRGISCYVGGYPNEILISEQISDGVIDQIPGSFYAYFSAMVIVCGFGYYHQYNQYKKEGPGKTYHPYHYL